MKSEPIYLVVKWKVKPEHLATVLSLLDEMGSQSIAETGNLLYRVHQATDDPTILYLYEVYQDAEAIEFHKASAHYQSIVAEKIIPLLDEREVVKLKPVFVEK